MKNRLKRECLRSIGIFALLVFIFASLLENMFLGLIIPLCIVAVYIGIVILWIQKKGDDLE
jgi:hypothetical protein